MEKRAYCIPAEGSKIYLPNGTLIPAEGMDLELTTYVRRRILDGGLVVTKKPPQKAEVSTKES